MRVAVPKPKVIDRVAVPSRLRVFLADVHALIECGDEATLIPSGDLLQAKDACGGLTEDGMYGFTFFPVEGLRTKWELMFTRDDIAAIAAGRMATLDLWRCQDESCGCMFWSPDETCFHCDYIDGDAERFPPGAYDTRREWVRAYIALHPETAPLQMIGAYNSQPHLGRELGYFSLDEANAMLAEFQQGRDPAAT